MEGKQKMVVTMYIIITVAIATTNSYCLWVITMGQYLF